MPLTPETLTKHELVGLRVRVVSATNPDLEAIEGRVVAETMRTLTVESESRARQVPKRGARFEFALTDEAADSREGSGTASKLGSETAGERSGQSDSGEGVAYVTVDGATLLSRPALRTETGGNSKWR
ncbi:ribonuclease P protein component 1 [Haladaptatus halobius]|jgi:ribonuclease P protein subunit POP4|uniref:ribonuclease P protein component 1 n=1 Tax=Haladaptatus halobius TaxID=2884875 RepID=UPI001D0B3053|nr:ribonuclease P protein component 1 [Haladaptatus halobius]